MSDDAKPAYLRGRGRGTPHQLAAAGDRNTQRPGRTNDDWKSHTTSPAYSRLSQVSATPESQLRGECEFG